MLLYWIVVSILWVVVHLVWRIEIIGRENLEAARKNGGWIVAANHISNVDPVFIVVCIYDLTRMRVLAKAELFQNWFCRWFFHCMGAIAVNRGKGDTRVLDKVTSECRRGKGVLIFAEGTRTKDGYLGNLKSGAFVIAASAGASMVPCRILYDTENGRQRIFCKVRICFGPAIPAAELQIKDPTHKIAELRRMKKRLAADLEQLAEEHYFPAPAFDPRPSARLAAKTAASTLPAVAGQTAQTAPAPAEQGAAPTATEETQPLLTLDVEAPQSPALDTTPAIKPEDAATPAQSPSEGE